MYINSTLKFLIESKCLTTTGAAPDKPCIFPFIHKGVEYNECISYEHGEHWCSTKVNVTGNIEGEEKKVHWA